MRQEQIEAAIEAGRDQERMLAAVRHKQRELETGRSQQAEAAKLIAQHRQADAEAEQPTAAGPLSDAAILDWLAIHATHIYVRGGGSISPCLRVNIRIAMEAPEPPPPRASRAGIPRKTP